jgi:hypothetical protein
MRARSFPERETPDLAASLCGIRHVGLFEDGSLFGAGVASSGF